MKKHPTVVPVDPAALRGLATHAESHWLTFATAIRCYAHQPTKPAVRKAANKHGPTWLRAALRGDVPKSQTQRTVQRPKEFDRQSGSLAHLLAGAEEAMKPPTEKPQKKPSEAVLIPPPADDATHQSEPLIR